MFRFRYQAFSHWIGKDVSTDRNQVFILSRNMVVKALLPQFALYSEFPCNPRRETFELPDNLENADRCSARRHGNMQMIGHETVAIDFTFQRALNVGKRFDDFF